MVQSWGQLQEHVSWLGGFELSQTLTEAYVVKSSDTIQNPAPVSANRELEPLPDGPYKDLPYNELLRPT